MVNGVSRRARVASVVSRMVFLFSPDHFAATFIQTAARRSTIEDRSRPRTLLLLRCYVLNIYIITSVYPYETCCPYRVILRTNFPSKKRRFLLATSRLHPYENHRVAEETVIPRTWLRDEIYGNTGPTHSPILLHHIGVFHRERIIHNFFPNIFLK